MEENWNPFKVNEKVEGNALYLRGTEGAHADVVDSKVWMILEAIKRGWDIHIEYADIRGEFNLSEIELWLERDEKDRLVIQVSISIINSELQEARFNNIRFTKPVSFQGTTFKRRPVFNKSYFETSATFHRAKFLSGMFLLETEFKSTADFGKCYFGDDANFMRVRFTGANESMGDISFRDSIFMGYTYFNGGYLGKNVDFTNAKFNTDASFYTDLNKLSPVSLESIGLAYRRSSLIGAGIFFEKAGQKYFGERTWINVGRSDYDDVFPSASKSFRNAKLEYEKEGKYDDARRMYVREMDAIRQELKIQKKSKRRKSKPIRRFLLFLWKLSSEYGESPLRFAVCSLFIIIVFALGYLPIIPDRVGWWPSWLTIEFDGHPYANGNIYLTAWYFSVVTFATLGFGDITPLSDFGKVVVTLEVLSGYVMFGILITLVARRMTRS